MLPSVLLSVKKKVKLSNSSDLKQTVQTNFLCLRLVLTGSSLALPPVSADLYNISAETCIRWPLRCHSNGGSEVIVAVGRNGAIYSHGAAMWSVSMRKGLVDFQHEQKQAGFWSESL